MKILCIRKLVGVVGVNAVYLQTLVALATLCCRCLSASIDIVLLTSPYDISIALTSLLLCTHKTRNFWLIMPLINVQLASKSWWNNVHLASLERRLYSCGTSSQAMHYLCLQPQHPGSSYNLNASSAHLCQWYQNQMVGSCCSLLFIHTK